MASGLAIFPAHVFAQRGIRVTVDGTPLSLDVEPVIRNGRTLVPMRAIFERLGATVDWNAGTGTITARRSNQTIQLTIGSATASVDGRRVNLDVPAEIVSNRTLVPVRFVSEALGARVDWAADTQTVIISQGGVSLPLSVQEAESRLNEYFRGINPELFVMAPSNQSSNTVRFERRFRNTGNRYSPNRLVGIVTVDLSTGIAISESIDGSDRVHINLITLQVVR